MNPPMRKPERICLVGVGLIGGSIGMGLIQREPAVEVVGVDVDAAVLAAAVRQEAIHRGTTDLAQGVRGADLVVLAIPPGEVGVVAAAMAAHLAPGAVVTDVASTKKAPAQAIEACLPEHAAYLGGHPMAGSERAGIAAADPYLFENAVWALTPTGRSTARAWELVSWLVATLGAHPLSLSPAEHDLAVAATSHLPYLVAVALIHTLDGHEAALKLAGRGLRDVTRVAGSDPRLWREILLSNKEEVLLTLASFRRHLNELAALLEGNKEEVLEGALARGREGRSRLPAGLRAYLPALEEVVLTIPDRPGSLALVTGLLGQAGINIADIEIMGVREGEGGSVRLGFAGEEAAARALEVLGAAGIKCRRR